MVLALRVDDDVADPAVRLLEQLAEEVALPGARGALDEEVSGEELVEVDSERAGRAVGGRGKRERAGHGYAGSGYLGKGSASTSGRSRPP